jgi:hypothetical protein
MNKLGFPDLDNLYESISNLSDPQEALDQVIQSEISRPVLSKALLKFKKTNVVCKQYDSVFMFKFVVWHSLYNLSVGQTECQTNDRLCVFSTSKTRSQMQKLFGCLE